MSGTLAQFDFEELEAAGAEAAARVAGLLERAHREADAIADEARARGYDEGLAAAAARLEPARTALEQAAQGLAEVRGEAAETAEVRAVELALALAEKILGAALDVRPELVQQVVAGALRRAGAADRLVLAVHPDDADLVLACVDGLPHGTGGRPPEVLADRRVGRGGCIVSTGDGEIDVRLDQQLERAADVLRETLASGG